MVNYGIRPPEVGNSVDEQMRGKRVGHQSCAFLTRRFLQVKRSGWCSVVISFRYETDILNVDDEYIAVGTVYKALFSVSRGVFKDNNSDIHTELKLQWRVNSMAVLPSYLSG